MSTISSRVKYFVCLALVLAGVRVHAASAAGTAFTYQGRLNDGAGPASGVYDFRFTLYDSAGGGTVVGSTQAIDGLAVTNGLVAVPLDFGAAPFDGDARWLEILVRAQGAPAYTTLAPRQPLTPGPYAIRAEMVPASGLQGPISDVSLSTNVALLDSSKQFFTGLNIFNDRVSVGTTATPDRPFAVAGAGVNGEWISLQTIGGNTAWHLNNSQGGLNFAQTAVADYRLFLSTNGNVGVGASAPASKLTVNGDIRLGSSGQYLAPGAGERLRIVRGTILANGQIANGTGFTVVRNSLGNYTVTLTPAFPDIPAVTVSPVTTAPNTVSVANLSAGQFQLIAFTNAGNPTEPAAICFTAIGAP